MLKHVQVWRLFRQTMRTGGQTLTNGLTQLSSTWSCQREASMLSIWGNLSVHVRRTRLRASWYFDLGCPWHGWNVSHSTTDSSVGSLLMWRSHYMRSAVVWIERCCSVGSFMVAKALWDAFRSGLMGTLRCAVGWSYCWTTATTWMAGWVFATGMMFLATGRRLLVTQCLVKKKK